jgi:branched-chain amino acid transport system permease protein
VQIFWRPIFGAFVLTFMPEFFRAVQAWRMELYGLLLIIMMILKPEGVITNNTVRSIAKMLRRS